MIDVTQLIEAYPYYPYHELPFLDADLLRARYVRQVQEEIKAAVPKIHLADKTSTVLLLAPSNPWDSRHFGKQIVDLQAISVSSEHGTDGHQQRFELLRKALRNLVEQTKEKTWEVEYLRVDSRDLASIWAAESSGFRMYAGNVTYAHNLSGIHPREQRADLAHPKDLPTLLDITQKAFGSNLVTSTRYYADPHFDKRKVTELYDFWMRNSASGQLADSIVVVRNDSGRVIGYATLRWQRLSDLGLAEVGLIAVSPQSQGKGVALRLLDASLHLAKTNNCTCLLLGTQVDNYAIQKSMIRSGFRPAYTKYVYHRWDQA